jgi:hypothetical protein
VPCAIVSSASTLVVYDSSGAALAYSVVEPPRGAPKPAVPDLCFEAHSLPPDMMTPCFDEDGLHGEADETCMCGDPGPHIHAHVRSPGCARHNEARLTAVKLAPHDGGPLAFPVTPALPADCHHGVARLPKASPARPGSLRVRHGDHYDDLVPHGDGDTLLLRHSHGPHSDYHGVLKLSCEREGVLRVFKPGEGRFKITDYLPSVDLGGDGRVKAALDVMPKKCKSVGAAKAKIGQPSGGGCCGGGGGGGGHDHAHAHEADGGEESDADADAAPGSGKSTLHVQNICCASEIPPIRAIVEPLPGVSKVSFNITSKLVYVEHEFGRTSAPRIVEELNKARFGATLRKDAGAAAALSRPAEPAPELPEPASLGGLRWNVVLSGVLWVLSMFSPLYSPLLYLAIGSFVIGIWHIMLKAYEACKRYVRAKRAQRRARPSQHSIAAACERSERKEGRGHP